MVFDHMDWSSHTPVRTGYSAMVRFTKLRVIGTGTILDAWKLGLSIIVVPNTHLLDDHQTEMAKHLAKEGYATMSTTR